MDNQEQQPTPTPSTPGMSEIQHKVDEWFTYHAPSPSDVEKYARIRHAGKQLAYAILESTPVGADQSAAIRKVREAVMTANAAVACGGA